ncbi:MAG: SDR family NAD(P)-dependent oxidoreductase [Desulfobacter sp.]
MIVLKESIFVNRHIEQVFRYTSDFGNIRDWDPGVVSSKKKVSSKKEQPGVPGVGTTYDLILKFGPFRPKMQYVTVEYVPHSRVVLTGKGDTFSATDIITFEREADGTRIHYRAEIEFSGVTGRMDALLAPVLEKTGRDAVAGLKKTLGRENGLSEGDSWFSSGSNLADYFADHAILPGMFMFTSLGYRISQWFQKDTEATKDTLSGKTVVITGATSGIGRAAAFRLAEKKADLIFIARNREKARDVRQQIIEQTGNPHVDFLVADLSLMADIKDLVIRLRQRRKSIDVLINNAGALFTERAETPEGIERTFATDLLGVFYLTQLLRHRLSRPGARIINVSSGGMYTQKIDVNDLENRELPYNGAKAYARAKRGVVILTRRWAEQMAHAGIAVHAMHPGWVDTPGIQQALPGFHSLVGPVLRTPDQGADTMVWLAASKTAGQCTGRFWLDRRPHETAVFPKTNESETERQLLWQRLNRITERFQDLQKV